MYTALLWEQEGDRIRCGLCPHRCLISAGATGVCGVRKNVDGTLIALTYGTISSIAADPIEKKPVYHYFPGTAVLSIGSIGCSMKCGHCQNWRISRARPGEAADEVELHTLSPEAVVDMARKYRCPGVAFTYNEPVIWAEYVRDVARLCRESGLFTVMVTNGYITSEGLDLLGPHLDVWRVDLKGATDETYRRLCKVSSVEPIMKAAVRAKTQWEMHVEVVTNVIPTINDSAEELRTMAVWIAEALGADTPWHVTRFFPYLEFADLPATPIETLRMARAIGQEAGLHHVYVGNVEDPQGEDTICPSCRSVAVRRSGYTILDRRTRGGSCAKCGRDLNIVE
ncbi:MAG: AmmeMemoRadiSam system radical SAM enzyme [Actinomycetota bacterium]|nr:AmmeMemoRadiSam system radical SAM enzyme [Actinomycetota bacterium]